MIPHIIDTNCLISFVTDRNPHQTQIMDKILNNVSELKEEIYIISNVVTEFVYVLESIYNVDKKIISKIIDELLENPGVTYHHGYFPKTVLKFWPDKIKDFGDAVIAAASKELHAHIYTFDKDFHSQLTKLKMKCSLL